MKRFWPTFTGYASAAAVIGAVMLSRCAGTAQSPAGEGLPAPAPARDPEPAPLVPVVPADPAPPPAAAPGSAESAAASAPAAARRYVVAALGDSLTDPRSQGGKYLELLSDRCPKSRFDSFGKGGDMVNQMRRRFATEVFAGSPGAGAQRSEYTHVIVFGGVNDLLSDKTAGRTPRKITEDLAAIYRAAREHGARVIAITVSPWGSFADYNPSRAAATREVNQFIAAQLTSGAVDHVVDSAPLLSCGDPERLCARYGGPFKDGLHFGREGHRALGDALHRHVFSDCE